MKKKILVVDDEEAVTDMIVTALQDNKEYDLWKTTNSQEAYQMASKEFYDLLICDMQMPQLSGETLFLCLGIDPDNCMRKKPQPKLLLISGTFDHQYMQKAVETVGSNGATYLRKPFDTDTLKYKVASMLSTL